jgi:hypothetical protein
MNMTTTRERTSASIAGVWSPVGGHHPADPGLDVRGPALTLWMDAARHHDDDRWRDTRVAALWHIHGRVRREGILVVGCTDPRRVGRVEPTLFQYFRTEGGRGVIFDFEVANAEEIARLGLAGWHRGADPSPIGDPVSLVAVDYDVTTVLCGRRVRSGDLIDLIPNGGRAA